MSIEDKLYKFLSFYKEMPDWSKRLITTPFKILPRKYYLGNIYKVFYEEAKMLEYASEKRIEEYQWLKTKKLLKNAYETVPYYKETWQKHGINLNQIQSFEDFSKIIPFVTRDMVQKSPEKFLSDLYSKKDYLKMNSGGSTGIPLTLYYLKSYSRAAEWAHMHLQWNRVGFKIGKRIATLRGDYIGKNRIYSFDPWRNTLILSSFNLNKNSADDYIDLLDKYKIEFINAYPSSLFNLIQLSSFNRRPVSSLKAILLGSENIIEWQLEKFKEYFETDKLFYWYGHVELCALGGGCELSSNYHFMPSYSYVEFIPTSKIDSKNEDDKTIEIVGTSFINPLMPLIRYRTQDFGIESKQKCPCGRNHKLLKKVIGREQEIAVGLNGERITLTALIFGRHADYFNHIIKMQVINNAPGKLIVKIVPKVSFSDSHADEIVNTLSRKEGMPFETKVEIVDKIETTKRGKHRFFIRTFD